MKRLSLALCGFLAFSCASTPWPGEERIEHDEDFDATSEMPVDETQPATSGEKTGRPPSDAKSKGLAQTYQAPPPAGLRAKEILERHNAKCRGTQPPAGLVLAGRVQVESPGRKLMGPAELVFEPGGRFVERLTLAGNADDLEYGEGIESERGFDGVAGWRKDARAGAYFVDDVEKDSFAVDARLILGRLEEVLGAFEYVDTIELEGAPAHRVSGRTKSGEVFHLSFHRDTNLLLEVEHVNPVDPKKPLSRLTLLQVFTERGLCVPRRIQVQSGEERRVFEWGEPKLGQAPAKIALPAELENIGGLEDL